MRVHYRIHRIDANFGADARCATGTDAGVCAAEVPFAALRCNYVLLITRSNITSSNGNFIAIRMNVDRWLQVHRDSILEEAAGNEKRVNLQAEAISR